MVYMKNIMGFRLTSSFSRAHSATSVCRKMSASGHQWLTHIFLTTWEAEIGRIVV
jgi:hypothetical protein